MKLFIHIYLVYLMVLASSAHCQVNPATNSPNPSFDSIDTKENNKSPNNVYGINCNSNTFFALTNLGQIKEYNLAGNTTNFIQNIVLCDGKALAYCNNLNGSAFNPTFYSSNVNSEPAYYDGTNWVTFSGGNYVGNAGGYENYLYYQNSNEIFKYDGVNFTIIYTLPSGVFVMADLAVDSLGNIWFPKGPPNSPQCDSINVISPTGQIIKQFKFNYNIMNAYGSFMLNNILYIGLGSANTSVPNTLLPITFDADSAVIGNPISFPGTFFDLASCSPGSPLVGIKNKKTIDVSIAPNPFTSYTKIEFPTQQKNITIKILDLWGKEIKKTEFSGTELLIEKNEIKEGVYFIHILKENQNICIKKIIVL